MPAGLRIWVLGAGATALAGFRYWGNLRGICQVLAFIAQVLALATLAEAAS